MGELNAPEDRVSTLTLTATNQTAVVSISSEPDTEQDYPISLLVSTTEILSSAPLLTYNDSTGAVEFYSFFASTQDTEGGPSSSNSRYKEDIQVRTYPNYTSVSFDSPFPSSSFSLPFDYSQTKFLGILTNPSASGVLTETFDGSKWTAGAVSEFSEWGGEGDSFSSTEVLPHIYAYQFGLSYDKDEVLDYFKVSSTSNTTVTINASALKTIKIDLAPFDWQSKQITQTFSASANISQIPFAKLFIKNYFNIKNQPVEIFSVGAIQSPYTLESIFLQSDLSVEGITLSGAVLSGAMIFNEIGVTDLSATAVLKNTDTNTSQPVTVVFPSMLEIVSSYDEVDEDYYQTETTPVTLPYSDYPRISPNEWVVADNVNSIIEKIYNTLDDLNKYTKLYGPKNKFYGWIGPKGKSQTTTIETTTPIYVWQDLECPSNTESEATWAVLECPTTNFPLTWEYHECDGSQTDPTCLGKYCIEWKWKSRKCNVSELNVKWKDTKCASSLAKKWRFEKCETDSGSLNCDRDHWKISTIDEIYFPIPSCTFTDRCKIIDVEHISKTDQYVFALPTEIHLVNNDYVATYLARRGSADELFSFQNIVGVTSDSNGNVYVLDSTLSRVSVFTIKDNSFKFFTSWGTFGLATTPQGLNLPGDIHIDQYNTIWIADTGNECVKNFALNGKNHLILTSDKFKGNAPLSVCVDSQNNVHCLTPKAVYVFSSKGVYLFEYILPVDVTNPKKINTSFNREVIYITYDLGIIKFFRTGTLFGYLLNEYQCSTKQTLQGYNSISQDRFRNVLVTIGDKVLKIPDLMHIVDAKAVISEELFWSLNEILVHKEEYIQPWVYLKSFHRLWDNIELFRTSLFYQETGCKSYRPPTHSKEQLVIGQNEIVTNAVLNRLSKQLWTNLESLFDYFDPDCSETN